jgi:hypothetical protein
VDEQNEKALLDSVASPLRAFLIEVHEIYHEVLDVGFPTDVAGMVVSDMISAGIAARSGVSPDEKINYSIDGDANYEYDEEYYEDEEEFDTDNDEGDTPKDERE